MIVFDLRCPGGHVFEAWFTSSIAYDTQREAGQIRCPVCDDGDVTKAVMAPAIGSKGDRAGPGIEAEGAPAHLKDAMCALAAAQAKLLERSSWVGSAFADRARAMHAGEEATAPIHGQASAADARALIEEGVRVAPLPLPVVPPKALN